ncbi:divalent-cation tolerance protein CutA [bacterium]|nr:divalent-cation tolerance protein CutA [bacterium]
MNFLEVQTTFSSREEAEKVCKALIEERLAACVNLYDTRSMYWWKGMIEEEGEVIAVFKTSEDKYDALSIKLKELHSYEIPMIVAVPIVKGSREYLSWLEESLEQGV